MKTPTTLHLLPLVAAMLGLGSTAWAGDAAKAKPIVLREFKAKQRELGPGIDGVTYDRKTYKYSRSQIVRLKEDHTLLLSAWSATFQPRITVRQKGKARILKHGRFEAKPAKSGGNTFRVTRLEFTPPDRGDFVISVSTDTITQGVYFIQGRIWGVSKAQAAAADPYAPTTTEASLAGFTYKAYKPYVSKRHHYVGGEYARGKSKAQVGATWLEGGDSMETRITPEHKTKGKQFGKVDRKEGNVYYFEPETTRNQGTFTIISYKIMLFHPTKEAEVLVRVPVAHKAAIPAFVVKARAMLAKYAALARPRP